MQKNDPYAALRIKEFNIFLLLRFALVFGWSMQFVVIEWQVYSLTNDELSLGIIGLCEFLPAFFLAPFAGHIVDRKEKRNLFTVCIALFSLISFGLFWLTSENVEAYWETKSILIGIYSLVFFGGVLRAFFGPTIFSLTSSDMLQKRAVEKRWTKSADIAKPSNASAATRVRRTLRKIYWRKETG